MTLRGEATQGTGRYERRLSIVLAVGWLVLVLGRNAIPPLLPTIVTDLQLSTAEAGFVMTVVMGMHAVLQYPAGRISDQLSRLTVLTVSLLTTMVGFGMLLAADSYVTLLAGGAVVGVGTGLFFTPGRALLADHFSTRLGRVLGLQTTAGLVGAALSGVLVTAVVASVAWRYTFVVPLLGTGIVLTSLHVLSRESYVLARPSLDVLDTIRRLLGDVSVRRLLAVATIRSVVNQSLISFLPLVLIEAKSFDPALANGVYASLFVVGAVVSPFMGGVGDRFSHRTVMPGLLGLGALGISLLVVSNSTPVLVFGVGLASVGMWGFAPVMQAAFLEDLSADSSGGDFGALKTVYAGVGSAGPSLFGLLAVTGGYSLALTASVGCLLVTILLLLVWGR